MSTKRSSEEGLPTGGSQTMKKRMRVLVDQQLKTNSAIFQTKMFECNWAEALRVANERNMYIDNSRLYGPRERDAGKSMLELWARMDKHATTPEESNASELVTGLFEILINTKAHEAVELVSKNLYQILYEPAVVSRAAMRCLLSRPDLISIDSAFNVLARFKIGPNSTHQYSMHNLALKALELSLASPNAYMLLNRLEFYSRVTSNPLRSAIVYGELQLLEKLLVLIPMIDLDVYALPGDCEICQKLEKCVTHCWVSAEKWMREMLAGDVAVVRSVVRTARETLEDYRFNRTVLVEELLYEANVLPLDVCHLINAYGARPEDV